MFNSSSYALSFSHHIFLHRTSHHTPKMKYERWCCLIPEDQKGSQRWIASILWQATQEGCHVCWLRPLVRVARWFLPPWIQLADTWETRGRYGGGTVAWLNNGQVQKWAIGQHWCRGTRSHIQASRVLIKLYWIWIYKLVIKIWDIAS